MGFWHTTVGKFIHHSTGGLVGPNIKHIHHTGPSYPGLTPSEVPKECHTDIEYYIKHQDICWPRPTMPDMPPPISVGPGTGGPVILPPNGPVSSVPEPSSVVLFIASMIVVGLFRGFRKKY